jgi:hypothetical protein
MTHIGIITQLQVQRASLKRGEHPNQTYSPNDIVPVEALRLTPEGAMAVSAGRKLLDVHNAAHPNTKYSAEHGNALSLNFLANYAQMRARFGDHITVGCAGENMLIETDPALFLTMRDLARGLRIEGPDGTYVELRQVAPAPPCAPFSRWALGSLGAVADATLLKQTLQFLDRGTRGYYCASEGTGEVRLGDHVYLIGD